MEETGGNAARLDPKSVVEAALFLANRALRLEELASVVNMPAERVEGLVAELADDLQQRGSALKISVREDPGRLAGTEVRLEIRGEFVPAVSALSQNVNLPPKAVKILALVAKKKKLLQSELKYYFKGDVYEYVDDLVSKGYLSEAKFKTTKELKPTKLFFEHFKGVE
ncbi:MAG: SMC-Scp complex subunit ScpB [Candidatus Micrarchaeota archaeon]